MNEYCRSLCVLSRSLTYRTVATRCACATQGSVTANLNFAGSATAMVVHPARTENLLGPRSNTVPGTLWPTDATSAEDLLATRVYGGPLTTATSEAHGIVSVSLPLFT